MGTNLNRSCLIGGLFFLAGCGGTSRLASEQEGGAGPGQTATVPGDAGASQEPPDGDTPPMCKGTYEKLEVDWGGHEPSVNAPLTRPSFGQLVAWPEQRRVAVIASYETVAIFELGAEADASVRLVEMLSATDAGLPSGSGFAQLAVQGAGLILQGHEGYFGMPRLMAWYPETGLTEIAEPPQGVAGARLLVDPEHGVLLGGYLASSPDGEWREVGSDWGGQPVAFDGDAVLISVRSLGHYELERWSLDGEKLEAVVTRGAVEVTAPARGGLLIGEVGSSSPLSGGQAALEWLAPANELRQLAELQVISPTDAWDGALDIVLREPQLFIAHGRSGLVTGVWTGDVVELTSVEGMEAYARQVELIDDILVVAGDELAFARWCN